jgi:ferredoxin--NADP+ reductase
MFALPVKHVHEFAPGIFELALERRGYVFTPGELAVIYNDGKDSRPYSIASGTGEDILRFLIRRMDDGAVTNWLFERKPGEHVRISTPYGYFRPGQEGMPGRPGVFVATGVGIAPFLCYLRSATPSHRPTCLYGARVLADAVALDFLEERTHLCMALSREDVAGTHRGHVTDLLSDLAFDTDTHFYLCGLDAMVDEVAYWLNAQGIEAERVHTEVFFSSEEGE